MTVLDIKKKFAPILPKGEKSVQRFLKEALLWRLQETNEKIALLEAAYNQSFDEFKKSWKKMKNSKRYSYKAESDYLDWEALEEYKRDLMNVMHSF